MTPMKALRCGCGGIVLTESSATVSRTITSWTCTYLIGSGANLPAWVITPAGATCKGAAACPALPAGGVRLTTAGNTY